MRVLITGGGTGGHIYPAIAIANKLKTKMENIEILFVGTEKGLECQLVPKAGYVLKTITVSGFKRRLSLDTVKSVKDLFCGIKDALGIIKEFKPDLVIGTGGYVCGPVVFMASLFNIKTLIHEQNVIPGVTNKILGKFVDKICVSFEESNQYFHHTNKIVVTGNPVREDFIYVNKEKCRKALGISDDQLVVMAFGGSRGAEKINKTMIDVLSEFNGSKDVILIHVTGSKHYEKVLSALRQKNTVIKDNLIIKEYIYDMATFMGACDAVICRAGAITLAEVTAMGLPSVLIPSPYVTNNHQEYNAKVLEKNGAAILLQEQDLESQRLIDLIYFFQQNRGKLKEMGKKSKCLFKPNAVDKIYMNILELINS